MIRKLTNEELPEASAQTREDPKRAGTQLEGRTVSEEVLDLKLTLDHDPQILVSTAVKGSSYFYIYIYCEYFRSMRTLIKH